MQQTTSITNAVPPIRPTLIPPLQRGPGVLLRATLGWQRLWRCVREVTLLEVLAFWPLCIAGFFYALLFSALRAWPFLVLLWLLWPWLH